MNKDIVILEVSVQNYKYIINKIIKNNISIINSKIKSSKYVFEIYLDDYNLLKKLDYKNTITLVKQKGLYNLKNIIYENIFYIVITFIIISVLFLSNIFILKINVHTNDKTLERKIIYYLEDNKISSFSIAKDFNKLNDIKESILDKFNNEIEWLEITKNGYKYDVNVIKRKIRINKGNKSKCNYVASKSGTITKIKVKKGMLLVQENNHVNPGDILISGDIIYNDELKSEVCASGIIFGEVWYEFDIKYPLIKNEKINKKNKFYNITINLFKKQYLLFKNKYNNNTIKYKFGNDIFGISIISSNKKEIKKIKLKEKEALKIINKKIKNNVRLKSGKNSKIIEQNVLKKYIKNDTINMKVLVTVEEEIGVVENY